MSYSQRRTRAPLNSIYFQKKGNLICIFIWQQNTCKYTKAHSCSSFTPLIAKPKTTKHNNLSKYFKT